MDSSKQPSYDTIRHKLDSDMLSASTLSTEPERRGFINQTFTSIYKLYQEKQVDHAEYVKLINRLAAFKQGEYNDYIDVLAGSALMGVLDLTIQGEVPALLPEQARQRSQAVTDLTSVKPAQPEE